MLETRHICETDLPAQGWAGARERVLPFVGRIVSLTPGERVVVERVLDLEEDLYLADHAFVHAPGVKPLSACLPVLPMTMSVEVMAEVAACVVPGRGLIGVEKVKATRWIELLDTSTATLTIEARLENYDPHREACYVRAAVYAEGQNAPSIEATLLFGANYLQELFPAFGESDPRSARRIDARSLYEERRLFHGPAFRCLSGELLVEERRVAAELVVPEADKLFRSTASPQLLLQPALLDNLCQIVGVWAMQRERYAFPVGFGKLELYGPTPPAGTLTPARLELTKTEGKTIHADVEVEDGAGCVWLRITDLQCWKFQWERQLVDYRRAPGEFLLGRPASIGNPGTGPLCLMLSEQDLGKFEPKMLARDCMSVDESVIFEKHARIPKRQRQWLLARALAKDCVRLYESRIAGAPMAHPASIVIESDAVGRPFVAGRDGTPHISLSHCEDRALAAAHRDPVGVDIERIVERDGAFVEAFASEREREFLNALPPDLHSEWTTRLWCAKESVGKLLGSGMGGRLKTVSLETVDGHRILMRDATSARSFWVETAKSDAFILAYAVES